MAYKLEDFVEGGVKGITHCIGTVVDAGEVSGDYGMQFKVSLEDVEVIKADNPELVGPRDNLDVYYSKKLSKKAAFYDVVAAYLELGLELDEDGGNIVGKRLEFKQARLVKGIDRDTGEELVSKPLLPIDVVSGKKPKTKAVASGRPTRLPERGLLRKRESQRREEPEEEDE